MTILASNPEPIRYAPQAGAIVAIEPQALELVLLEAPRPAEPYAVAGGAATVLEITGPLCYASPLLDTYGAIRKRFDAALAAAPEIVILKINSPGGDVAGAFDLSRYMRSAAAAAGKRLIAFSEAAMCSSGYALGCAASRIVCADTATLGSVGVLSALENRAVQNAAMGLRHYIVSSGARKADGNPNLPMTPEALATIQTAVDAMAGVFFELVRDARGFDPQPLEARTFVGAAAVAERLADEVASWDSLLADVAQSAGGARHSNVAAQAFAAAAKTPNMAFPDKDEDKKDAKAGSALRAALAKAAEGDDKEEAARAKRALSAFDDDEDKKAKASSDEDKEKEAKAKAAAAPAASVTASADPVVAALQSQIQAQAASLKALQDQAAVKAAAEESAARDALFASRPDVAPTVIATVKDFPLAAAKAVLDAIPRGPGLPTLARTPLVGGGDPTATDHSAPEVQAKLDVEFGIAKAEHGHSFNSSSLVQTFGASKGSK
jgi:ClpP class serine protease